MNKYTCHLLFHPVVLEASSTFSTRNVWDQECQLSLFGREHFLSSKNISQLNILFIYFSFLSTSHFLSIYFLPLTSLCCSIFIIWLLFAFTWYLNCDVQFASLACSTVQKSWWKLEFPVALECYEQTQSQNPYFLGPDGTRTAKTLSIWEFGVRCRHPVGADTQGAFSSRIDWENISVYIV